MKLISDPTLPLWLGKSVYPIFPQYQSYGNGNKFNFFLEIQSKTSARISISTVNP